MTIKAPRDFWSGLIFCGLGIAFALIARNYQIGSAMRMGPGYFPIILGLLLALSGLILVGRSFVVEGPPVPRLRFTALAIVVASLLLFGVVYHWLGLVPAVIALVFASTLAGRELRPKEALGLAALLAFLSAVVFVVLLKLPLRLGPDF